jgi:hypothetical protein
MLYGSKVAGFYNLVVLKLFWPTYNFAGIKDPMDHLLPSFLLATERKISVVIIGNMTLLLMTHQRDNVWFQAAELQSHVRLHVKPVPIIRFLAYNIKNPIWQEYVLGDSSRCIRVALLIPGYLDHLWS